MHTPLNIHAVTEPAFAENAYLVWTRPDGPCWIIDPGLPPSVDQIARHIADQRLAVAAILLTHGHADHIAGLPEAIRRYPEAAVLASRQTQRALSDPADNLSADIGLQLRIAAKSATDLAPGDSLELDHTRWHVLDTSGHAPGSRSLYCPEARVVIVGDALFAGSIGRTDFHHSDHDQLIRNIREKLLVLPDETRVYSGHGPLTTIGRERRSNPFLQ